MDVFASLFSSWATRKRGWALLLVFSFAPAPAAPAPFQWTVQGPQVTHHLVGSVHLLPQQAQPLAAALDRAFAASAVLVFESDIDGLDDPQVQMQMLAAAQSADGIRAEIGNTQYRRLQQRLSAVDLPPALCDLFRAWFCSITLEVTEFTRQGFRPEFGIDQQLFQRAAAAGKRRQWLEPLPQHLALFTGMTPQMSVQFLTATLDGMEQDAVPPQRLLEIWRNNDLAAVTRMVAQMKARQPLAYERLLAGRNRSWLPQLATLLRADTPVLVVVGAAHYAGPDGLPELLRAQGFELRPVTD